MPNSSTQPWEFENRRELVDHGNTEARGLLLDIAGDALEAVHPRVTIPEILERDETTMHVAGTRYELDDFDSISVIGAGKGASAMVAALDDQLSDRIDRRLIVEKHGQAPAVAESGARVIEAGHPVPDAESVRAGELVLELATAAGPRDLVIVCITGGASSLLAVPVSGIELGDLAVLNEELLASGLPIDLINAVRKAISRIKGGALAARIAPAHLITLVVIDEVAGDPWGPTITDPPSQELAISILKDADLWGSIPESIRSYLEQQPSVTRGFRYRHSDRSRHQIVSVADAVDLCAGALRAVRRRGCEGIILGSAIEGESREVGIVHAGIATEAAVRGNPIEPPCILISGGETTVTLADRSDIGRGGPNQEFALALATRITNHPSITGLAIDTDGTDGPTSNAGGLVDASTFDRLNEREIDPAIQLQMHDAATALESVSDAVVSGPTGTNVMDLRLIHVDECTP